MKRIGVVNVALLARDFAEELDSASSVGAELSGTECALLALLLRGGINEKQAESELETSDSSLREPAKRQHSKPEPVETAKAPKKRGRPAKATAPGPCEVGENPAAPIDPPAAHTHVFRSGLAAMFPATHGGPWNCIASGHVFEGLACKHCNRPVHDNPAAPYPAGGAV